MEKKLYGYHVVLTTHNSRTSNRMRTYGVLKGPSLLLTLPEEIVLTEIIGNIIQENGYKCIAYNICRDHIHLLIVCPEDQLSRIMQKLKSISSKRFHRSGKITGHQPGKHHGHLWSQKFFRANLDEWTLARLSTQPGEVYRSSYLMNAMEYIRKNRKKHMLEESEELEKIISSFTITIEEAYEL